MIVAVVEDPVAAVEVGQEGTQTPVVGETLKFEKCPAEGSGKYTNTSWYVYPWENLKKRCTYIYGNYIHCNKIVHLP